MGAFEGVRGNGQDTKEDFVGESDLFFFSNGGVVLVDEVMVIEEESVVTIVLGVPEDLTQEQVVLGEHGRFNRSNNLSQVQEDTDIFELSEGLSVEAHLESIRSTV